MTNWRCFTKPFHRGGLALLRKANPLWRIGFASQSHFIVMDWLCFAKPILWVSRNWLCFAKPFHRGLALLRKANQSSRKMSSLYENVCISVNNGMLGASLLATKKGGESLDTTVIDSVNKTFAPRFPNRGLWGVTDRPTDRHFAF